ncbi:hypothetical protein IWZ03DRAFT_201197 [Phyllosticta citriasiana]|uniref:Uncharacterized protein n=1 Tax=Phyllosticta citriasiana TaxID=595635 RepID=A0ABR1KJZ3_9PEZI
MNVIDVVANIMQRLSERIRIRINQVLHTIHSSSRLCGNGIDLLEGVLNVLHVGDQDGGDVRIVGGDAAAAAAGVGDGGGGGREARARVQEGFAGEELRLARLDGFVLPEGLCAGEEGGSGGGELYRRRDARVSGGEGGAQHVERAAGGVVLLEEERQRGDDADVGGGGDGARRLVGRVVDEVEAVGLREEQVALLAGVARQAGDVDVWDETVSLAEIVDRGGGKHGGGWLGSLVSMRSVREVGELTICWRSTRSPI